MRRHVIATRGPGPRDTHRATKSSQRTRAAKADRVTFRSGVLCVPERRPEPGGVAAVPAASADHTFFPGRRSRRVALIAIFVVAVVVRDPFPDVADHVVRA